MKHFNFKDQLGAILILFLGLKVKVTWQLNSQWRSEHLGEQLLLSKV